MDNLPKPSPHPLLYQIPTRDWLNRFSSGAQLCHLDEIPSSELDRIASVGFNWIWLLGVWQTGPLGAELSRTNPQWRAEYQQALPDFREQDITGSPFAIDAYEVHRDFGGPASLASLRERLATRGIRLLLDFVPNHTAPDHPWVKVHPDYYVIGSETDLANQPGNFVRLSTEWGMQILARGRDPYFAAWPDTLQLNYGNPALRAAMTEELRKIAGKCDGVRCDMAMLVLPEVFKRTWGIEAEPFWPAAIAAAREVRPDFLLIAEVYWGLDRELQELGFDYTYDKTLYDLLLQQDAKDIRIYLKMDVAFLRKSVHFLENHDEPRISAQLSPAIHKAAAAVTFLLPGLRFLHDGQMEGFRRKPSVHLGRRMVEPTDPEVSSFYAKLLSLLDTPIVSGDWVQLETRRAWQDNPTEECFIAFGWRTERRFTAFLAVNYADHPSQCYVSFPEQTWTGTGKVVLENKWDSERYERAEAELQSNGFYLDVHRWSVQLFQILPV